MLSIFSRCKTVNIQCPDGTTKIVYRNIDDAFPLYIPGWQGKVNVSADYLKQLKTNMSADYATKIQGLLYKLDDLNQGLMLRFRAIYIVFQSDPCNKIDSFDQGVKNLIEEEKHLRAFKLQIDCLIQLVKDKSINSNLFHEKYGDVILRMGMESDSASYIQEIKESRQAASQMLKGN